LLSFNDSDLDVPKEVELAAAVDGDFLDGTATILVSPVTSGIADRDVIAAEDDPDAPTILYVDDDAPGGNGTSWEEALSSLQEAFAAAWSQDEINEICVAAGTYEPTEGTDRTLSFELRNGLVVKGGYAGLANPGNPDERDIDAYRTVLSGDIDVEGDSSDNSWHVVIANAVDSNARLDGLTIAYGNADAGNTNDQEGGGLLMWDGSATIANCKFLSNSGTYGGGAFVRSSSAPIIDSEFHSNTASVQGGGVCWLGSGTAELTRCSFTENSTGYYGGGVLVATESLHLTNCRFAGNTAYYGGGLCNYLPDAAITNCTFSGNYSTRGGGVYNAYGDVTVSNSTIAGNTASLGGGIYVVSGGSLTMANSVFWGNSDSAGTGTSGQIDSDGSATIAVNHTCVQDDDPNDVNIYPGTGNIDDDPLFSRAPDDGGDGWGVGDNDDYGDLHLQCGSRCIDTGDDGALPDDVADLDDDGDTDEALPYDLVGNDRTLDGDASCPAHVDMGAIEYPETATADNLLPEQLVTVTPGCEGGSDPTENSIVEITNTATGTGSITVSATREDVHPDAGGFQAIGTTLIVDTTLNNGEFFMTVMIPFDEAELAGRYPLSVDLVWFDSTAGDAGEWELAVEGNIQPSTGHEPDVVGDRFEVEDTVLPSLSPDLGDYGVFWNPSTLRGFAWANVDHTTDFAVGILPCSAADSPQMEADAMGKNRYLSLVPGGPGIQTALRVTLTSMPSEFSSYEGTQYWVGEPFEMCENSGQGPEVAPEDCGPAWIGGPVLTMWSANLQDTQYCYDFGSIDLLHVTDCEIVPGARYAVEAIACTCDTGSATSYSDPLVITTSSWGNICGPWDAGNYRWSGPDTSVDIVFDVTACVEKFKNVAGAPLKPRADIDPNVPDGKINITSDVTKILDAFGGDPYPFDGPGTCPP
jgi:hypothetical protein